MSIHYVGKCITCSREIEIYSVLPQDRQCADCQYFTKPVRSSKQPKFNQDEFWLFFKGWPDRPLDKREAAHAKKILPGILRTSVSGEGRWVKILFLWDSATFALEK